MDTQNIGEREFRENLAALLQGRGPLAITRRGEPLGFFILAQNRNRKSEIDAVRAAATELDTMIASWRASEDELWPDSV